MESTPEPVLPIFQYYEGFYSFNCYFGMENRRNIGTRNLIDWTVFSDWVRSQIDHLQITPDKAVICLYHGLNNAEEIQTGIRVIGADTVIVRGTESAALIPREPSHRLTLTGPEVKYLGNQKRTCEIVELTEPWTDLNGYKNNMYVHRYPAYPERLSFKQFVTKVDIEIVMFPWSIEVMLLASQNLVQNLDNGFLVISDYASYVDKSMTETRLVVDGPSGFYHSKSLHMARLINNEVVDLLSPMNSVSVINFKNQALDYGNMCPPLCDRVRF